MNCGMQNKGLSLPASALMGCASDRRTMIILLYTQYYYQGTISTTRCHPESSARHLVSPIGEYVLSHQKWKLYDYWDFKVSTTKETENQRGDIFISQDHINTGWTLGLCSNQTSLRNPFTPTNLNYQKINIMKFSVVSIVSLFAIFSHGLAASCASYYGLLLL